MEKIKGIEKFIIVTPEGNHYLEHLYEIDKNDYKYETGIWKKNKLIINENIHKLESLKVRSKLQDKMLKRLKKMKKKYYQKS